ncbi:DSF synthase [Rhodoblastus acidophilus]|uniref:crotonase/enoyl-CoA hydratase family protein n=1 Tax=Rhodoblastus acidophilus TaxID=1074 RepID=UPI002224C380|nr:crotonase/enoyl-CoA hydratase family protein [Rhodoblastus acidophilus]MCW2315171.1 DSF synthase [Rhodoblastus acidophilus]
MTRMVNFSSLPTATPIVGAAAPLLSGQRAARQDLTARQDLAARQESASPQGGAQPHGAAPLAWLSRPRATLDLSFDARHGAVWCAMRHENSVSWTLPMLREMNAVAEDLRAEARAGETAVKFFIGSSLRPRVFNMGGDLSYFLDRVRARDEDSLRAYAYACCDAIYNNYHGFDAPVVTVALLQGDALGGGLEAALSCQVIIAERGISLGFPEALFHTFPGMGAYSLLARRLDGARAEKLMLSGRMYKSEDFFDMGLIDILTEPGEGRARTQAYVADQAKRQKLLVAMGQVRRRVAPLTLQELRDVTDIWVDSVMSLAPINLRKMEMLALAQDRLFGQTSSQRFG